MAVAVNPLALATEGGYPLSAIGLATSGYITPQGGPGPGTEPEPEPEPTPPPSTGGGGGGVSRRGYRADLPLEREIDYEQLAADLFETVAHWGSDSLQLAREIAGQLGAKETEESRLAAALGVLFAEDEDDD